MELDYLLTPSGLNPLTVALVREEMESSSDDEFAKGFKTTKQDAAEILEAWELSFMHRWGSDELVSAIALSDRHRIKPLIRRAVEMAQATRSLPEFFTPADGIRWAMQSGYLIIGILATLTGNKPGMYGHPSNLDNMAQNGPTHAEAHTKPIHAWKKEARAIGEDWLTEQRKAGANPSVQAVANHVEGELSNRNCTGPHGKLLYAATIKREALKGITGRKANGKK